MKMENKAVTVRKSDQLLPPLLISLNPTPNTTQSPPPGYIPATPPPDNDRSQ